MQSRWCKSAAFFMLALFILKACVDEICNSICNGMQPSASKWLRSSCEKRPCGAP